MKSKRNKHTAKRMRSRQKKHECSTAVQIMQNIIDIRTHSGGGIHRRKENRVWKKKYNGKVYPNSAKEHVSHQHAQMVRHVTRTATHAPCLVVTLWRRNILSRSQRGARTEPQHVPFINACPLIREPISVCAPHYKLKNNIDIAAAVHIAVARCKLKRKTTERNEHIQTYEKDETRAGRLWETP